MHMQLSIRQIKYLRRAASRAKAISKPNRPQYSIVKLLKLSHDKKQ